MSASSAPSMPDQQRRYRLTGRFWWLIIAFVVVNIGSAFVHQGWKAWQLRTQIAQAEQKLEAIYGKTQDLREEYAYLQSEAYIEEAARQELGLVMPGETAVIMVEAGNDGDVERREGANRTPGF